MVRGKPKNGKRTRRTRQQLLEAEAAILNGTHVMSSYHTTVENTSTEVPLSAMSTLSSSIIDSSSTTNSHNNQKKSLRILFQDAKSGKLGKKHRSSRIRNYRWPRTVEAANSPFDDATGKNKMFFVLAINLYPDSKIVQPSDSESDEEENYDPVDNAVGQPNSISEPNNNVPCDTEAANAVLVPTCVGNADEASMHEKSPSPVSPKVKRGRRPHNARRVPYGRAGDIDHSWRSNYNRRCIQRKTHRQARNRIKDPQLIMDVINTVVERFAEGLNMPLNHSVEDHSNNTNGVSSYVDIHQRIDHVPRTPPPELIAENLMFIKQEVLSPEPSDVEVDVVDDDEGDEEDVSVENDSADKEYVDVCGDYEDDEDDEDDFFPNF